MPDQILFVHSSGTQEHGQGSSALYDYLFTHLAWDYEFLHPDMPNPSGPTYQSWKARLNKEFTQVRDNVILIGHSLGASVLLKFLDEEMPQVSIRALFMLAAPFWGLGEDWSHGDYALRDNFGARLAIPIFLYHSNDDEIVPQAHQRCYFDTLENVTACKLSGYGHYFRDGLPVLMTDLKGLSTSKW